MKLSQYNHILDIEENKKLLFNCTTCALGEIDSENFENIKKIFSNVSKGSIDKSEDSELYEMLKEGCFIIDDDVDEIEMYSNFRKEAKKNPKELDITIAPTLDCNFKCIYCYESDVQCDNNNKNMNEDMIETIIKFIESKIKELGCTSILIRWFGGEPMLKYDFLVKTSSKINELAKLYDKPITYSMITNGYLLDGEKAKVLSNLGLRDVQITLDGTKEINDNRRMLKNNNGSFDTIIKNIKEFSSYLATTLRVNLDNTNISNMDDFLDCLAKENLRDKIEVTFSITKAMGSCCSGIESKYFKDEEFAKELIKLHYKALFKNFKINDYPSSIALNCSAVTGAGFVIEPDGTLQRCHCCIGDKEKSIGNIFDTSINKENDEKWMNWNPLKYKKCSSCNILPICMGGCPYEDLYNNETACAIWKYNLKDSLKLNYFIENQ